MQTWTQRLTSRKFLLCLAAIVVAGGQFVLGNIDANALVLAITGAVASYQLGEGLADSGRSAAVINNA